MARWREDVIRADGSRGRMHRTVVLGLVSEFPRRRQALTILEERLRPLNRGLRPVQSTMLFREFVQSDWTNLVLPTLKLSTQHGYRTVLRKHLLPYFGERRLCDVSKLDVQQFVAEKFRQNLAWQTVRNAWIVISSVFDSAVEYGYLAANPARGVKFPPRTVGVKPPVLSAKSFARLLKHLEEPYKTMVAITALTGLWIGELLALRWKIVDFDARTIRVAESVFEGQFQNPKSEKSVRTIPLGPFAERLLKNQFKQSARTGPEDLVFSNCKGGPQREAYLLERVLRPAGEVAEIGRVTWHQLRHAHASILHDIGAPAKVVQEQVGHAAIETTLGIYTHAFPETHRRAVENLERVLFPNGPKFTRRRKSRK